MKIVYKNGLIYTELKITNGGKTSVVKDIVVDTGAAHTIISPDAINDLDIGVSVNDEFITMYGVGGEQYAYRKIIDGLEIGDYYIESSKIDFGLIDDKGEINGLLGLDLLIKCEAEIDLKNFNISVNKSR